MEESDNANNKSELIKHYDKYGDEGDVTMPMLMESRYIGTSNTEQVIG